MVYIHILKLTNNKYYVYGSVDRISNFENYYNGGCLEWTSKYKAIQTYDILPDCEESDEDKYVNMYMGRFGVNNVRGGSYNTYKLSDDNIASLKVLSNNTRLKCFKCGKMGHLSKYCFSAKKKGTNRVRNDLHCFRCGRSTHTSPSCYATKHIDGTILEKILTPDGL